MIERYEELPPRLYAGDIAACFRFLDARLATDGHVADYWHWRAVTHLRAGQFHEALDKCFSLTRQSDVFAFQIHCMADVCLHLGLKEVALAGIENYANRPATSPLAALLWRVYGWHYLGEDDRLLQLGADGLDEHSVHVLGHHQARSLMRRDGIAHGITRMQRHWCSHDARRTLIPGVDHSAYWNSQRELPARLSILPVASGIGDLINWARYIDALRAMGVEVEHDADLFRLSGNASDYPALAAAMKNAGFTRASDDTSSTMWTEPFALFTALFPVLGYLPRPRYIEPVDASAVDTLVDTIRQRAGGRRCIGIFWSSCESPSNFAGRSLVLPHLHSLFDAHDDIHWVIMQRGFERARWLNDPRAADTRRFSTLPLDLTLGQSVALLDRLDGFVGNDGSLIHIAGALGKPAWLMLNQVAEWRYERAPDSTPWYPGVRLVRAPALGDWAGLVDALSARLASGAR